MSAWRDLQAMADKSVLGMFSEWLEFTPYTSSPNGRPKQDLSRTGLTLTAVLYWPDDKIIVAPDAKFNVRTEASPARVAINRLDYPELVIRQGDQLQALDRAGQPILKVRKVTADSRDIIVLEVGQ